MLALCFSGDFSIILFSALYISGNEHSFGSSIAVLIKWVYCVPTSCPPFSLDKSVLFLKTCSFQSSRK